jgi:hypothetical protein
LNLDLFQQSNENKIRNHTKSTVVGKAKIMTSEDIALAKRKREEKEAAREAKRRKKSASFQPPLTLYDCEFYSRYSAETSLDSVSGGVNAPRKLVWLRGKVEEDAHQLDEGCKLRLQRILNARERAFLGHSLLLKQNLDLFQQSYSLRLVDGRPPQLCHVTRLACEG